MKNIEVVRLKLLIENKYPELKADQDNIIALAKVIEKLKKNSK